MCIYKLCNLVNFTACAKFLENINLCCIQKNRSVGYVMLQNNYYITILLSNSIRETCRVWLRHVSVWLKILSIDQMDSKQETADKTKFIGSDLLKFILMCQQISL